MSLFWTVLPDLASPTGAYGWFSATFQRYQSHPHHVNMKIQTDALCCLGVRRPASLEHLQGQPETLYLPRLTLAAPPGIGDSWPVMLNTPGTLADKDPVSRHE